MVKTIKCEIQSDRDLFQGEVYNNCDCQEEKEGGDVGGSKQTGLNASHKMGPMENMVRKRGRPSYFKLWTQYDLYDSL